MPHAAPVGSPPTTCTSVAVRSSQGARRKAGASEASADGTQLEPELHSGPSCGSGGGVEPGGVELPRGKLERFRATYNRITEYQEGAKSYLHNNRMVRL